MTEFWESSFREKKTMWGYEPADSAIAAMEFFRKHGLKKILIPGSGYGRNADFFSRNGFDVTGIEISETAIELARQLYGDNLKVYHGSVSSMPFDNELYDGIFCFALIHLLNARERAKLIRNCYSQLRTDGYMFFAAISTEASTYGTGKKKSKDRYELIPGATIFFYDQNSIEKEFGNYGIIEAKETDELLNYHENKPSLRFWRIVCRK